MGIADNYVPIKVLGNGFTAVFSGNWNIITKGFERVYLEDAITGVQILQTLGTDYNLIFDDSGFTVTFSVSPPVGQYVVIGREVSQDQTIPYTTSKGFQGKVTENSFDKLTAMVQDQSDLINRAPKLPLGNTLDFTIATPIAKKGLRISDDGMSIIMGQDNLDEIKTATQSIADAAQASANSAAASATSAALQAAALTGSSATSNTIATGTKVFATQASKNFNGNNLRIYSAANSANFMDGLGTYDGVSALSVAVTSIGGSGTFTDWVITVNGVRGAQGANGAAGTLPIAAATGTADAILANYTPDLTLSDGTMCIVVASGANTVTNPTFSPDGLTAHAITKNGGAALVAGDIPGALSVLYLEYNLANTRWELLNPAGSVAGRAIFNAATAAAQRTAMGVVIGTNVQAWDADLDALSGLATAANTIPYFSGTGTAALATLTTNTLLGLGSSLGPIALGSNLSMAGNTLNASGGTEVVLLATATASGSASLVFTSVMNSSLYSAYELVIEQLKFSANNTPLIRYSTNNGSTYLSSSYDTTVESKTGGTITPSTGALTTGVCFAGTTGGANVVANGVARFSAKYDNVGGVAPAINFEGTSNGTKIKTTGSNAAIAADPNAIEIIPSSGTITSGKVYLYGIKNTQEKLK